MGFVMGKFKTNNIAIFKDIESLRDSIFAEEVNIVFNKFLENERLNGKYIVNQSQSKELSDEIIARAKEDFFDEDNFHRNWNSNAPRAISEAWKVQSITGVWCNNVNFHPTPDALKEDLDYFEENLSIIELQADGEEYAAEWELKFEFELLTDVCVIIIDDSQGNSRIKLYDLFAHGLLGIVKNIEEYKGDEEITWRELIPEAQKIIAENIKEAQKKTAHTSPPLRH